MIPITTSARPTLVKIEPTPQVELYVQVFAPAEVRKNLSNLFKYKVEGCEFMPSYNEVDLQGRRKWDGYIRMFEFDTGYIYRGLLPYVLDYLESKGIPYKVNEELETSFHIPDPMLDKLISEFVTSKPLRKYQIECFKIAVKEHRATFVSSTGSGKSMMMYLLARYIPVKTLIIVPRKGLRRQLFSELQKYDPDWDLESEVEVIEGTKDLGTGKRVTIATWQSIYNHHSSWFNEFDMIIGDECHGFEARNLQAMMEKAWNVPMRFGFTGSLRETKINRVILEGLFGPVHVLSRTKELQEEGILADLKIKCFYLEYSHRDRMRFPYRCSYADELKFIGSHEGRNDFIINLALTLSGNSLFLFAYIDDQLELFRKRLEAEINSRGLTEKHPVYVVHGKTKIDTDEIREIIEKVSGAFILTTYGKFQEGVDITNLHSLFMMSPSESQVRVVQSIGRGLRRSEEKTMATLYDIVDDISSTGWMNHTLDHYKSRIKIYMEQGFNFKQHKVELP